jgi:formylglycine-generating enzyme required for sulfatase activity
VSFFYNSFVYGGSDVVFVRWREKMTEFQNIVENIGRVKEIFHGGRFLVVTIYGLDNLGMEFVLIPPGTFIMGSDNTFAHYAHDEMPQHSVTISKPFCLGKYEVTQEQWEAVMGNNPSEIKGRSNPVEQVSWHDTQVFIRCLNQRGNHNCYRLPTEAEWEYAARAGTIGAYSFGNDIDTLGQYAWYIDNSNGKTHPVGQKQPNSWGLYDMYGNVWEWVNDWYADKYYSNRPSIDPCGPSSGSRRVGRGGSWNGDVSTCRSASRSSGSPGYCGAILGFRLAFSLG